MDFFIDHPMDLMLGVVSMGEKMEIKSHHQYLRVDRREICYLKSILEAYGHVAVVRTVDPRMGIIELIYPPAFSNRVSSIIDHLKMEILIENVKEISESWSMGSFLE